MARIALRVSDTQLKHWREDARKEGLSLSGYIRFRIESASKQEELADKLSRCLADLEDYLAHSIFMSPNL